MTHPFLSQAPRAVLVAWAASSWRRCSGAARVSGRDRNLRAQDMKLTRGINSKGEKRVASRGIRRGGAREREGQILRLVAGLAGEARGGRRATESRGILPYHRLRPEQERDPRCQGRQLFPQ